MIHMHVKHSNNGYPTSKLSPYVCSLVDRKFGMHVILSLDLLITEEIFEQYSAL